MAITLSLVSATRNQLRYLCTQDGQAGTVAELANAGGASPDFRTDAALYPLASFPRAGLDGFPPLAAGTFTTAQIRAMLLADDPNSAVLTNDLIGRCKAFITPREGNRSWSVDAGAAVTSPVDRSDPTYAVRTDDTTAGTAYLDIVYQNTPER